MDTVETMHSKICAQMQHIQARIAVLTDLDPGQLTHLISRCDEIMSSYSMAVLAPLASYYSTDRPSEIQESTSQYYRALQSENTVLLIAALVRQLDALDGCNSSLGISNITSAETHHDICCGQKMDVFAELSELHCAACGQTKQLLGIAFNDAQFYPQGSSRRDTRSQYDPGRHCRTWLDRIQANENATFTAELLQKIKYVIDRDNYNIQMLTCECMRRILKDSAVNETAFNNHVPLLVKTFGGKPPPQLTFAERAEVIKRFNIVMQRYEELYPNSRNRPYYPYFIYRILKSMQLPADKQAIFDYIHIQRTETVMKNDAIYDEICNQ